MQNKYKYKILTFAIQTKFVHKMSQRRNFNNKKIETCNLNT